MSEEKDQLPDEPDNKPEEPEHKPVEPGDKPPWAGGPGGPDRPDPPQAAEGWTVVSDTTYLEMRQASPGEDLTGVAISVASEQIMTAFVGHPAGGLITRHPGDLNRANWWFTPEAVANQRYKAS